MARILLVDDDAPLRSILAETLKHFGHTVVEAGDGKEALERFDLGPVDLVITDIVMPEVEGLAVLMELRKKNPPVKVIAISGGGSMGKVEYLHVAKLMGASAILAKPFSSAALMAAVDAILKENATAAGGSPKAV